jgi:predicted amidophosphoribosyltransferase
MSNERYCLNDGARMLEACPGCEARITSPYARFCGTCGLELARALEQRRN